MLLHRRPPYEEETRKSKKCIFNSPLVIAYLQASNNIVSLII